jgi:hypothetical protein
VNAYYPFLCAVSDDEVYAAVTDRTMPEGLIFARVPGSAATFVAEAPPPIPAQSSVERVQLACFPGGNLWAYGTIRSGGGSSYFVQHRASGGAAWAPVALPPRAAGTTNYAVSSALLRADGSGYFAFYDSFDRQTVFERRADGSWVESLVLDPNSSVATFAGDPGGHAVAAINASDARYLELRQGVWSVVPARGFRSVRGAAVSPSGLVLTGAMGTELTMAYGREPGFAPVDLGLPGTLQQIVFPTASDRRALLITYGNPSLVTAYDWVP